MTELGKPIPASYWVILGKLLAGEYPGSIDVETARERIVRFSQAGFDTFIDLTQAGELEPYATLLNEQAIYARFPIRDRGLPERQLALEALNVVDEALATGRKVYLHCWGGVGRTGMIVGCYLVRHGMSGQQAVSQIADWWQHSPKRDRYPRSPETDEQVRFILNWQE